MRLKTIKLAGFKSFVDPTQVHFRSNLSAVVGPNGCGKSNVIDAVRWVMGESSAKTLRGAAMTDVIFNGSTQRAPVGKASIELVFDNSDASLGGEWARFSEIAVRREVNRDGQSKYLLNGTVCRRKDVTDLFLGTGLGPRSYAIIEQGMINRFIEARPDELRAYVEEAAGVSRYKERRKETQSRLDRTRDNLDRLADLEDELARHVQHLSRQAEAAKRYQALGESIVSTKAQLVAKRWHLAQQQYLAHEAGLLACSQSLEEAQVASQSLAAKRDVLKTQYETAQASFEATQATHYSQGAVLARLEQQAKDLRRQVDEARERQVRRDRRRSQLNQALEATRAQLTQSQDQLTAATAAAQALERAREDKERAVSDAQAALAQQQSQASQARLALQKQQSDEAALKRTLDTAQRQLEQANTRVEQLRQRRPQAPKAGELPALEALTATLSEAHKTVAQAQVAFDQAEIEDRRWQAEHTQKLAELNQLERSWQKLASLIAKLSQSAERPLLSLLSPSAEQAWLGPALGPLSAAEAYPSLESVPWPPEGNVVWGDVPSDWLGHPWLRGARPIESLEAAKNALDQLGPVECWVTPEGYLVGPQFVLTEVPGSQGPLLKAQLAELDMERTAVEVELERLQARKPQTDLHHLRGELAAARTQEAAANQRLQAGRAALDRHQALSERYQQELSRFESDLKEAEQEREDRRAAAERAEAALLAFEPVDWEVPETAQAEESLRAHTRALRDWQADLNRAELAVVRAETEVASQQKDLARLSEEARRLEQSQHQATQDGNEAKLAEVEGELRDARQRQLSSEAALQKDRQGLSELDTAQREVEGALAERQQAMDALREQHLGLQTELTRAFEQRKTQASQLADLGFELNDAQSWDLSASETQLAVEVERLEKSQQRLGAVNLAALEELEAGRERQRYYQAQRADLDEAIATLEEAVRKIDRETRALFKSTFNQLNDSLKALFPKVFGGGEAWLELTEDDALVAGVVLMARPPGKRNSTIHLLSGGEKALTAVALVFSIFQLRPAPFCMLDEVDAPLDDANVGRYAQLLDEMSQTVQFIFITHNKLAMERAHQLLGVTMQEPGVSRLVSVDVEEAVQLAELE